MLTFPSAKINIGLHVTKKRADGFHNIETLFYPLAFREILEIVPSDHLQLNISGLPVEGNWENNLCVKAYHLLRQDFNLPSIAIYLHKVIPAGAGLGGGSSDAAHTLQLIDKLFDLHLSAEQLQAYAAVLGSDCAFFLHRQAMMASGRGEVLTPSSVSLQGKYILLVKPSVFVSTKDAYAGIVPKKPVQPLPELLELPLDQWRYSVVNDFEESIFIKYPMLAGAKESLYRSGAVYASMSGSGSALYGIYTDIKEWEKARQILADVLFSGLLA